MSGVHARIRMKQDNLLVIDLDSTNGTFIGDKRLKPGVVTTVSSGSYITFGTTLTLFLFISCLPFLLNNYVSFFSLYT